MTLRVEVLLKDERCENPNLLGKWHIFLPSEVFPDLQLVFFYFCAVFCDSWCFRMYFVLLNLRIHSMYTYDEALFRDRWIGPPGDTCIKQFWYMTFLCTST